MAKATATEYLGGLKFQAQEYDLNTIPGNDRAAEDAASMMFDIRMSALLHRMSDDDLEARVRTSNDIEFWVSLLERIGAACDAKRQDVEILDGGFIRLLVVLERLERPDKRLRAIRKRRDR